MDYTASALKIKAIYLEFIPNAFARVLCHNVRMIITDVAYDLTVGVVGAIIGAFLIGLATRRRTRNLRGQIVISQRDLAGLKLENNRLLETIKNRENEILELQKKILGLTRKK